MCGTMWWLRILYYITVKFRQLYKYLIRFILQNFLNDILTCGPLGRENLEIILMILFYQLPGWKITRYTCHGYNWNIEKTLKIRCSFCNWISNKSTSEARVSEFSGQKTNFVNNSISPNVKWEQQWRDFVKAF